MGTGWIAAAPPRAHVSLDAQVSRASGIAAQMLAIEFAFAET